MNFQPLPLHGKLTNVIDSAFYLGDYNPEHEIERLIPDRTISIVMELDRRDRYIYEISNFEVIQTCTGSWISGMHNHFISISALQETELIAIRFKPGGLFPFINMSVYKLYNKVVPALEYFPETIGELRSSIIEQKCIQKKFELVRKWLETHYRYAGALNSSIRKARRKILENPTLTRIFHRDFSERFVTNCDKIGLINILVLKLFTGCFAALRAKRFPRSEISGLTILEQIKNNVNYSEKQFIHLFKLQVGITPKMFQRIIRFNQILPLIQEPETINWAEISEECGYYDQSHFIRDFKRFSGFNPGEFLKSSSGRTNFIPLK